MRAHTREATRRRRWCEVDSTRRRRRRRQLLFVLLATFVSTFRTVDADATVGVQNGENSATTAAAATGAGAQGDALNPFPVKKHNPAGVLNGIHVRLPQKVR